MIYLLFNPLSIVPVQPKLEDKPFYCNAWCSKINTHVCCNTLPCCGFAHGMEKGIMREGSFKDYDKLGLHPLCPDCKIVLVKKDVLKTAHYGVVAYYHCNSCKETFVSRNKSELAIAAP